MSTRHLILAGFLAVAVGCEADQEPFEQGADLETPPAVEQAPATPVPSPPMGPATTDSVTPMEADSMEGGLVAPAQPGQAPPQTNQ